MRSKNGLEIRIKMWRAGISVAQISEKLGVTEPFVHQVITGLRQTQYIREAIAEALNRPVGKLWAKNNRRKAA